MEFEDDGKGFDPDTLPWMYAGPQSKATFGLRTMRGIAEMVGGTLEVASRPDLGTLLTLQVPLPPGLIEQENGRSTGGVEDQ